MAADVFKVLGIANASQAVASLDADEKSMLNIGLRGKAPWCVSESGLYALINQSRKPSAMDFKRWVRKEVLPAIRKDGAYIMGEEKVRTGELDEGHAIDPNLGRTNCGDDRRSISRALDQLKFEPIFR